MLGTCLGTSTLGLQQGWKSRPNKGHQGVPYTFNHIDSIWTIPRPNPKCLRLPKFQPQVTTSSCQRCTRSQNIYSSLDTSPRQCGDRFGKGQCWCCLRCCCWCWRWRAWCAWCCWYCWCCHPSWGKTKTAQLWKWSHERREWRRDPEQGLILRILLTDKNVAPNDVYVRIDKHKYTHLYISQIL